METEQTALQSLVLLSLGVGLTIGKASSSFQAEGELAASPAGPLSHTSIL